MRVLHVIHTLNPASGGTAEAVRNLVSHSGDAIQQVLTLDRSEDTWLKNFPGTVSCAGPGTGKYGYTSQLRNLLRVHLSSCDAAVVHGCWQFHGMATRAECKRAGIPYFVFPHGMLDPYFKNSSRTKHLKKMVYWPIERAVLGTARAVLFTCAEERDRAHLSFSFASRDETVPLGIHTPSADPGPQEILTRFPQLANQRVLLYLGRLHPKKGVDVLIDAFARIAPPNLHLLIAGPASSETYLEELRRLAGPVASKVTFAGMLTGTCKGSALSLAEALILPSHQENFGFSVVETLAFGRPVLISNQVNIWREIVKDGAGLVAPDTEPGTLDLLKRWLALSPEANLLMRQAARRCFEARFRADNSAARFLSVLRDCGVQSHDRSSSSLQLVHA